MRRELEIFQAALVDDEAECARLMVALDDAQLHDLIHVAQVVRATARQALVTRNYKDHVTPEAKHE